MGNVLSIVMEPCEGFGKIVTSALGASMSFVLGKMAMPSLR